MSLPPILCLALLYQEEMASLTKENDQHAKERKRLKNISAVLKSREVEIAKLKKNIATLECEKTKISSQMSNERRRDSKKIQQLVKQVKDLEKVIQKRFPNSLAALIMAANSPHRDAL